ncbi:ly6/PLAUR domain-containing protein 6B [Chanos chanos]|uniref:Ly6/PLAUR domain-containing protein 6B n=1 Tax=Chanos chanos TaxID=29144 RepID=A0A6J2WD46_CHACN|nr:ly6/PLAUR domain-containing protein 6B [Chanos chanos]
MKPHYMQTPGGYWTEMSPALKINILVFLLTGCQRMTIALFFLTSLQLLVASVTCDQINFYNVRPPVDATPYPKSFKCFTCEQASDNYNCNRWAEDKWCAQDTQYCMVIHHFNHHGRTKFVTKRCATQKDCQRVGCRHHRDNHHIECISCCEGMACNVEVPTNHSNAVFAMRRASSAAAPTARTWTAVSLLSFLLLGIFPL